MCRGLRTEVVSRLGVVDNAKSFVSRVDISRGDVQVESQIVALMPGMARVKWPEEFGSLKRLQ